MRVKRTYQEGTLQRGALHILRYFEKRRLVTCEHRDKDARLLMITNLWPHREKPYYGPFVKYTVDGIRNEGISCDVLFIHGYRTLWAYMAGAVAAFLLPFAYPDRYLLVHCHGGETALAARFFHGQPVVASYLGTDILGTQVGGNLRLRLKCWIRSFVLRRHAALMSGTTTKSAEMESLLVRAARRQNRIIPDGVDRELFRVRDRDEARIELGWPRDSAIVLFAGRADAPEKRLWLAQQAVVQASAQMQEIELQVAHRVTPSQMPLYYAAADCLLHTSVSEGSANVIKEALACNLPIVATPAGDTRELIEGVGDCTVCEANASALADALVHVLRPCRRSNGRAHTERLSTDVIARTTIDYYRTLGFPCK
jgi:glycosyltransferase involved in cell wall biosynthesis